MRLTRKVDPIKNKYQIEKVKEFFWHRINYPETMGAYNREYISKSSFKYLMLFTIGINTPFLVHEILSLKWNMLIDEDGIIKSSFNYNGYILPVVLSCKDIIRKYINTYPKDIKINNYIFSGSSNDTICDEALRKVLIQACNYADIHSNIGNATLRKTFAYWQIQSCNYDYEKLMQLQNILKHESMCLSKTFQYAGYSINDSNNFYVNSIIL